MGDAAKSLAAEIEAVIRDPVAVHLNMLRGTIAKPSIKNIIHLYGRDALLAALQSRAFEDGARKAEIFARRVHAGQTDKGGAPYSGHLGRVAARARGHAEAMGLRRQHVEWCLQVGWLHDTIEDTPVEADDLLDAGFDPAVVQAVGLLTRDEADNGPTYLAYVRNIIASGDRIAMIVKLSDNEDNTDPARPSTALVPRSLIERCTQSADLLRAALAEQEKGDA